MKKVLATFALVILFLGFTKIPSVYAQTPPADDIRHAECDLCGYCNGKEPPGDWAECRQCIYPAIDSEAIAKDTLKIDPAFNLPPTPAKGHYYTQIGCIITEVDDFTKPAGAAVLVNSILNRLIFPTVGGIAFLYLIYGAFILITSQANPEKLQQGKTMVMGAIIGLVFTLSVVLIINLIANQILNVPGVDDEDAEITGTITPTATQ